MQILRVVIIAVILACFLPLPGAPLSPAPAFASQSENFTPHYDADMMTRSLSAGGSYAKAWSDPDTVLNPDDADNDMKVGTAKATNWETWSSYLSFNTTSLDGVDITGASLHLMAYTGIEQAAGYEDIVVVEGLWGPTLAPADWATQKTVTVAGSDVVDLSTWASGNWYEIELNTSGLSWINTTGDFSYFALVNYPAFAGWSDPGTSADWREIRTSDYVSGKPVLEVFYTQSTDRTDIEIDSNSSYNHTAPGGEITAVSWISLRAAYSDEYLGFRLSGDVNEEFSLSLLSSAGVELAHVSDNIRDNGYYFWKTYVPHDFSGWIKVIESNFGIESTWGRVELPPLESVDAPYIVVGLPRNTSYGGMCDEMLCSGGVGILHWETTQGPTDFGDRALRWWFEGNSSQVSGNYTQQGILDSFLGNAVESGNDHMVRHRFIPFSLDLDGGNDRDGLIWDLSQAYSWETSGLYLPVLWDEDSDIQIGDAVSAAWYVCGSCSAEGLNVAIPGFAFESPASIDLSIFAGSDVYMLDRWDNVGIGWYTSAGNLISTHNTTLTINPLMIPSWMSIIAPGEDYSFRVTFVDSTDTTKWQYIVELPFTVGGVGGGAGTWDPDAIDASIEELGGIIGIGMDMLKYLILMIAAVVLFYVCRRDPTARLVAPGLVLGFGIVFGWLPIWVVVLLAVVVGFVVWKTVVGNDG